MAQPVDALICGGGVTGLWLRALLKSYGRSVVLIESDSLGSGQTIASQGIIHSGAKYSSRTVDAGLPDVLAVMTFAWGMHLAGENIPDLRGVEVNTEETWYWNPDVPLPACLENWWHHFHRGDMTAHESSIPSVLQHCRQARCNTKELSLSPASLLNVLAGDQRTDLLLVPTDHVHWEISGPGEVTAVRLQSSDGRNELKLQPRRVFLTAGAGTAALRAAMGLAGQAVMQLRTLRMAVVRGSLPRLCGHWFDDDGPRLTVSTQCDDAGRTIWQLGGRLAESASNQRPSDFLKHAREELLAGLPGLDLSHAQWSSYDAVRAEPTTAEGDLPDDVGILSEGNVITLWPTKLTLLPYLMIDFRRALDGAGERPTAKALDLRDWPQPPIAKPPWETLTGWVFDADLAGT